MTYFVLNIAISGKDGINVTTDSLFFAPNLGPRLYIFFMLNSAEYVILNAHKYNNFKKFSISQDHISLGC